MTKVMSNLLLLLYTVISYSSDCRYLLQSIQQTAGELCKHYNSLGSLQHKKDQEAPPSRRQLLLNHPTHSPTHPPTDGVRARVMSQPRPPPPGNIVPGRTAPLIPPQLIAPFQAAWERHAHDSANRHPVFFTERLMRIPPAFGGTPAPGLAMSPVAQGYVYQEGQIKATHASKL
ncbi:hypothetical protein F5883DRAFT_107197 [Diaporthe sp. PMI_573]|nr:hypothetical protein F5883DRAFT_107197 [Diaporthaceae sp. PMI_573]